jgi:predicted ArsR family transcriptional regulator
MTAVAIAEQLGISPTGVRRHLDTLISDGELEMRTASRRGPRGRGRPAKLFILTESGRARFGHAYDDLAVSAIRFLADNAGPDAIKAFAQQRVTSLISSHERAIGESDGQAERAEALALALTKEGYAASTRRVGTSGPNLGVQLCQHHCPVAHVAAEFPQLCEAETEAFAKLLGTHVQRLATIARGDTACTTHVPMTSSEAVISKAAISKETIAAQGKGQSESEEHGNSHHSDIDRSDIQSDATAVSSDAKAGPTNGGQSR